MMPGFCFWHTYLCGGGGGDDDDDDDDGGGGGKINTASCPKRLKSSFPIWF